MNEVRHFDPTLLTFDPADEDELLGQHTLMGGFEPVPVPEDSEEFDDASDEVEDAADEVEDFAEDEDDSWEEEDEDDEDED